MKRRELFKFGALAASVPFAGSLAEGASARQGGSAIAAQAKVNQLGWLENESPSYHQGQVWGMPWPKGQVKASESFILKDATGRESPIQTWVTAYWPDGSAKWTAHATTANVIPGALFEIKKGRTAKTALKVSLKESADSILLDTGVIRCLVNKSGDHIIQRIERNGVVIGEKARFVGQWQTQPEPDTESSFAIYNFTSKIQKVSIEQQGPIRAVVKVEGTHKSSDGREWLPFALRIYVVAGAESVRIAHTFVFDGDEYKDFIRALGLRFDIPMRDETYNRHVRFVGDQNGLWGESPKGITGLRRDPGKSVKEAQVQGLATPPLSSWDKRVSERMQWIPVWNDYTLSQLNANGFSLKKRTKAGHAWIDADQGKRASGVAYVGGASGGMLFGMRDFWQLHPTQLDIRNAGGDVAQATMWIWSPEAPAMDLRFYHDGMGQDTFEKQRDALDITYEDYEPGFGSPQGIARTSEFTLCALAATPSREMTIQIANSIRTPAQIVASPQTYLNAGVFGQLWSLPDRSVPARAALEDRLEWSINFYAQQVQQRHWFGFWNYGDVMHTYDADRHVWRYDVGGYAWDNSELSPDLWLWYSFLRTGSATAFRVAEAMNRHNRDVDIYHLGKFVGLGSRHNVQHWGCSSKQLRISTSAYRRFHYYLTADERTGDVLWEVVEADKKLDEVVPGRKLGDSAPAPGTHIGIGTDFGSAAANWLTAWERTGDKKYKSWLENAMKVIGNSEFGFFAKGYKFNTATKAMEAEAYENLTAGKLPVSHLNAVFGLVEVCAELNQLIDVPKFKLAWQRYCKFYNAPAAEVKAEFGTTLTGTNLIGAHSRLTAYVANQTNDKALAERAWSEFFKEPSQIPEAKRIDGPMVLNAIDEAAWVSTNDSAQWGLAAIQNLALVGRYLK